MGTNVAAGDATGTEVAGGDLPQAGEKQITIGYPETPKTIKVLANSNTGRRIKELGLDQIYSLWQLSPLDDAREQLLQSKWRKVQILRMEADLKLLELLEEESCVHPQNIPESSGIDRS